MALGMRKTVVKLMENVKRAPAKRAVRKLQGRGDAERRKRRGTTKGLDHVAAM